MKHLGNIGFIKIFNKIIMDMDYDNMTNPRYSKDEPPLSISNTIKKLKVPFLLNEPMKNGNTVYYHILRRYYFDIYWNFRSHWYSKNKPQELFVLQDINCCKYVESIDKNRKISKQSFENAEYYILMDINYLKPVVLLVSKDENINEIEKQLCCVEQNEKILKSEKINIVEKLEIEKLEIENWK